VVVFSNECFLYTSILLGNYQFLYSLDRMDWLSSITPSDLEPSIYRRDNGRKVCCPLECEICSFDDNSLPNRMNTLQCEIRSFDDNSLPNKDY